MVVSRFTLPIPKPRSGRCEELLRELAEAVEAPEDSGRVKTALVTAEELARLSPGLVKLVKRACNHHMRIERRVAVEDNICTIWVAVTAGLVRALRILALRRASGRWPTKECRIPYYFEELKNLAMLYSLAAVHVLARGEERDAILRRAGELYLWIMRWVEDYARRNGHLPQRPAGTDPSGTGSRP